MYTSNDIIKVIRRNWIMRLIIFPFSLKILSKVYFFLMIKQSDETVEFERKKIFDPLFIDIDLFYVPFIPPIRILVGGPSNQYGKKESSTRSILSKIGREFIRFLWGETCGWKERKISHFEEISFFLFLIRERNPIPLKNWWWKITSSVRKVRLGPAVKSKNPNVRSFPHLRLY